MCDAPAAAEGEGDAVAGQRDVGAVGIDPIVVGVVGKGLLDCVDCAGNVRLCHAGDLDRHVGLVVRCIVVEMDGL